MSNIRNLIQEDATRRQSKDSLINQTANFKEKEPAKIRQATINSFFTKNPLPLQRNANYLDVLGELEPNAFSIIYQAQVSQFSKRITSKAGGSDYTSFSADFEKKREALVSHYRNLLSRNVEIEKSIDDYKRALFQKKKLKYNLNELTRKGDAYVEGVTVMDLIKRFSNLINPKPTRINSNLHGSRTLKMIQSKRIQQETIDDSDKSKIDNHSRSGFINNSVTDPGGCVENHADDRIEIKLLKNKRNNYSLDQGLKAPIRRNVSLDNNGRVFMSKVGRPDTPERSIQETKPRVDLNLIRFNGIALVPEVKRVSQFSFQKNCGGSHYQVREGNIRQTQKERSMSNSLLNGRAENLSAYTITAEKKPSFFEKFNASKDFEPFRVEKVDKLTVNSGNSNFMGDLLGAYKKMTRRK